MLNLSSRLLIFSFFISISSFINQIILNLFLLQANGIKLLLEYRFLELIVIIPVGVLCSYIIDKKSIKTVIKISLFFQAIQTSLLILNQQNLEAVVLPMAFLSGASAVSMGLSFSLFISKQLTQINQYSYYSQATIVNQLSAIIFPLGSAFIIASYNYGLLFVVNFLSILFSLITLFFLKEKHIINTFNVKAIFAQPTPEMRTVLITNFLYGAEFIVITLLLPLLLVRFFGGESGWGLISTIIAFAAILFTFLVHKKFGSEKINVYGIVGFCISVVALTYIANGSQFILLLFILLVSFWQASQSFGLKPHMANIIHTLPNANTLETEYAVSLEIPFLLGRMLFLSILYIAHTTLQDNNTLGVLLLLFSLIPMYEVLFYTKKRFKKYKDSTKTYTQK